MGIFETHAHYDDEAFDEDRDSLLSGLPDNGIEFCINVGASVASTRNTLLLAEKYPHVFAAIGVHPTETAELTDDFMDFLAETARTNEKVVAIGEIGLDYHWPEPDKDIQKKWFIKQLDVAVKTGKPVIIHSRDAAKDTWDILSSPEYSSLRGVIHCYSYSPEMAADYVKLGYHIGVGGVVTYKNARKLVDTVKELDLGSILLETDSPYLSPVPLRGTRNSSLNLCYVRDMIAQIKGIDGEEVTRVTRENAMRLFLGETTA